MLLFPKTHSQYNHEQGIRQIPVLSFLQDTWLLIVVKIIKNKGSLRNCHSTSLMGIQIYLCVWFIKCFGLLEWWLLAMFLLCECLEIYRDGSLEYSTYLLPFLAMLIDPRTNTISQHNYMISIQWGLRDTRTWELGHFTGSALKRSVSWGIDVALDIVLSLPIPKSLWFNICHLCITYVSTHSAKKKTQKQFILLFVQANHN